MSEPGLTSRNPGGLLQQNEVALSLGLLSVLVIMLVPLPSFLLDALLAANLAMTLLLLLVTLTARQPLDLSTFPSMLLLLTLYRLSLNIATTRLILLDGNAGRIVSTFGGFVVGGNLVVGLVIFLILVVVQFVVITKGAGRISEVAARFALDALPGKQMAIDAELNAGAITDVDARQRRDELTSESEFYGAMDGSSKFVRGDAIAGLAITGVNLVGGMILGLTDGLTFVESIKTYSVLTIGDGLISQIPALIIATTAGILVTKTSSQSSLGQEIGEQMFKNPRALWMGVGLLGLIALTPGLPKLPFLGLSLGLFVILRRGHLKSEPEDRETPADESVAVEETEEDQMEGFLLTDRATLEVGARLVPLVKSNRTKGISERVTALRREFSQENGQWIPPIRIRDNLELGPESYRFVISGREVAQGTIRTERLLAIDPEQAPFTIAGEETVEPAFGIPARWIETGNRRQAELAGYTVVDPISALITHLGELLKRHAHELLSREDLRKLLDRVKTFAPTIVEELKPDIVRMGVLHQLLVQLVEERVPIADLTRVLESAVHHGPSTKQADELTDRVRQDLGRVLCDRFRDTDGALRVLLCEPQLEVRLRESLHQGQIAIPPAALNNLLVTLGEQWQSANRQRIEAALLVDQSLRRPLRTALLRNLPDLAVLSYAEVPGEFPITPLAIIPFDSVFSDSETAAPFGVDNSPTPALAPASSAA